MKLTTLLVLAGTMQLHARAIAQTVTYSAQSVGLPKVLSVIKEQTGYVFFYDKKVLADASPVSVELKNVPLKPALEIVLEGQPLSFEIQGNTVFITRKKKAPAPVPDPEASLDDVFVTLIDVHGRVTDSAGIPLSGASITVRGKRNGTQTDANGMFELNNVENNAMLIVSYTGYSNGEYKLNGQGDVVITLFRITSPLDEVHVIAYGSTTQRLSTGDVSTVTSKEIERQPVTNVLLALEGRVPGVFITQASGVPGSGVSVQIRGQNSINNGNDPLYVIDGVPYNSQFLTNLGYIMGGSNGSAGSPLSYINPADIESVSVLKDADATAIYGSRGANGVILITTKRGKAGDSRVDINAQNGYGNVTRKAPLLNLQQYLAMRHEAFNNDGLTPSLAHGDYDLLQWDTTHSTDWQKELIGNTANYTNIQGSVSGGNENTQFLIGTGYHRETNVFPKTDFSNQKGSAHFSVSNVSRNRKFKTSLTGSYMIDNNRLPNYDLTGSSLQFAPDAPPLRNPDGSLNWAPNSAGASTVGNILAQDTRSYQNRTNNLVLNTVLDYEILPGLSLHSSFGYTNMDTKELTLEPLTSFSPERQATAERSTLSATSNINSWIIEPQLTYKRTIGSSKLDFLLGSTIEQNNSISQTILGEGYNSDAVMNDLQSAATVYAWGSEEAIYKYNALFGRLNYNWKDEFLIDLTARRDGSSRFGPANEFHDFGAVGAAWIFTKEAFFGELLPFLSFGKLRASYGSTGNDQIGNYTYLSLFSPTGAAVAYQGVTGLTTYGPSNPYLQWELTKKLEIGLETGFLRDRILFKASYSRNRSSNQLLSYALPAITGFYGVSENFPATVQNTSLEFSVNTANIKTRDFSWTTDFNLTVPRNKLIAFANLATSSYAQYLLIGKPIGLTPAFHLEGVDPATGNYKFTSKTDPFNPDWSTDYFASYINLSPNFYGGIGNSITYKGFNLDFLFQFTKRIGRNAVYGSAPGAYASNQYTYMLARWQKPGDITTIGKATTNTTNAGYAGSSDGAYSDAAYIRLKNISLSWQMSNSWLKAMHFRNLKLFVQGQNLLTLTHYKGLDPETMGSGLPPLRVLTGGIELGL